MKQTTSLKLKQLFWDQDKDLIYTDRFVKITNEDQIVMGTGFESDPRLNRRKIKNVSATIYLRMRNRVLKGSPFTMKKKK